MFGTYFITPQETDTSRLLAITEAALQGGCLFVQYRDKQRPYSVQTQLGQHLLQLCHSYGARLLINDSVELARELNADGVHLGQEDGSVAAARQQLGPQALIGISTHNEAEARQALETMADYIALGSIFPTTSKADITLAGLELLRRISSFSDRPVVAIGGISVENAAQVYAAGASAVAVISAISDAGQPAQASRALSLAASYNGPELPHTAVLTVAGSDSGGGAGIQTDLKTLTLLGAYGASCLTALTAQNTCGVRRIEPVPLAQFEAELGAVLDDLPIAVVKTGMLYSADHISALCIQLAQRHQQPLLVADPVIIAKGGAQLLPEAARSCLQEALLPRTYLLTPNIPEAEALSGRQIKAAADMLPAARALASQGPSYILLKGGHLEQGQCQDLLLHSTSGRAWTITGPRHQTPHTHGTGCTYASAICAFLARGYPLPEAVAAARSFLDHAIHRAPGFGHGQGPVNLYAGAQSWNRQPHHPDIQLQEVTT